MEMNRVEPSAGVRRDHNRSRAAARLPGTREPVGGRTPVARIRPATPGVITSASRRPRWRLEFEPVSAPFVEPLMGWTGTADPFSQIRVNFPDMRSAIDFAEAQGWRRHVEEPPVRRRPSWAERT